MGACPAAANPPIVSAHTWHIWPQGFDHGAQASWELLPNIWERIAEEWFSLEEWVRTTGGICRSLQHVQPQSLTLGSRKDTPGSWRSPLLYLARHWQGCQHITLYVVVGGLIVVAPMPVNASLHDACMPKHAFQCPDEVPSKFA